MDHGNHDHAAIFPHLLAPDWPRFEPYYHETDWLFVSDFQWLVSRRYHFRAPKDSKNAQLVSLAGRKFRDETSNVSPNFAPRLSTKFARDHLKTTLTSCITQTDEGM